MTENYPTPQQWARLPKWAKGLIDDLRRENERLLADSERVLKRLGDVIDAGEGSTAFLDRYPGRKANENRQIPLGENAIVTFKTDVAGADVKKSTFEVQVTTVPATRLRQAGVRVMVNSWHGAAVYTEAGNVIVLRPGEVR